MPSLFLMASEYADDVCLKIKRDGEEVYSRCDITQTRQIIPIRHQFGVNFFIATLKNSFWCGEKEEKTAQSGSCSSLSKVYKKIF